MRREEQPFGMSPAQEYMFFGSAAKGRYRIFPKGRRFGATRGAAKAFIKWMADGNACLWGDTINSNIDRYVDRYFKPVLHATGIEYRWNTQKKIMQIGDGFTDFRSADRPENWEGFGYSKVFLNEAGIILNDEYIFNNAVMPMMLDYPESELIAAGTPKLLSGKGKLFHSLWRKAELGIDGYYGYRFTTYDNPYLDQRAITKLIAEIPPNERLQEIEGRFLTHGGNIVHLVWFKRYSIRPQEFIKIVHSWDTAYKPQQVNDPSVCTVWGQTANGHYLLDVFRARLDYPSLKKRAISLAARDRPDAILIEDKASGQSLIQELRADTSLPVVAITPVKDKITRMNTGSITIAAGNVFLPETAPWLNDYETEIAAFPIVDHDDQVDSTSQYLLWAKGPSDILIG